MIDSVMYFGIGFLVAALLCLLFVPLVHNRAVRLTMKRLEAATPLSIAEIRADKDQLRAEFAMSTRRLEMSVEKMKAKTTTQLAELGKKSDAINQLKKELGEKTATIFALEARDKTLRDQLRSTEEEFQIKSGSLREAERHLADKEAELTKLLGELGERSLVADSQRTEIAAFRVQIEAMKVSVSDYERAVAETEQRLGRERADAETAANELAAARGKLGDLNTRTTELERQLFVHQSEAEVLHRRVQDLEGRLTDQGRVLAERDYQLERLRNELDDARKSEVDLRSELATSGSRSSTAVERFRSDIAQLEAQLAAAIEERGKLQREIGTMKRDAEFDLGGRARRERAAARAHQRRRRRSGAADRGARRPRLADRIHADRGGERRPRRGGWRPRRSGGRERRYGGGRQEYARRPHPRAAIDRLSGGVDDLKYDPLIPVQAGIQPGSPLTRGRAEEPGSLDTPESRRLNRNSGPGA